MGRLALLREAKILGTAPERLLFLATDADRSVRATALENLALPMDRRGLLLRAHRGEALASTELEWLSTLGAHGKEVAATNIAAPDRLLLNLAKQGHLKTILRGRHTRDTAWFLEQAKSDHVLLRIMSEEAGIGWAVRRQAINLLKFLPPSAATTEETLSTVLPGDSAQESASANSPAAPPSLRERLLDRKDAYTLTQEEAAELTGTPALCRLASRHPYTHVRLLEWLDDQRPHGAARETLLNSLQHSPLDEDALRHFALHRDWELRAALAPNPCLPPPLLDLLARDADTLVRAASAEHPDLTPATLERLSADPSVLVREAVAAHPSTPLWALGQLAQDEEWEVQLSVARNPSCDVATLARLALNPHVQVREAVAAHLLSGGEILALLAQDVNERVSQVARLRLPGASQEALGAAASSKRRSVKLALATRQGAPRELLLALSADRSSAVRALAGLHPQLDYGARQRLQGDPDPQVRRVARAADSATSGDDLAALPRYDSRVKVALSRNGSTPTGVLDALSDDANIAVRSMVVLHPATPLSGLTRRLPELELRASIRQHPHYQGALQEQMQAQELHEAAQPDVSEDALRALLSSDSPEVRAVLARHVRTPLDAQVALAADPDPHVRVALLERGVVTEEIQHLLVADAAWKVQEALVHLPELAQGVMLALLKQPYIGHSLLAELAGHPDITPAVIDAFAAHPNTEARVLAARHPHVSSVALTRLAADPQEEVRQAVVVHSACPPGALHLLAQRPEHRLAVAHHPSTTSQTLESLAHDAGYARALRLPKTPKVLNVLREFLLHRASQRAFPQMALLLAVLQHPHATAQAVRSASRLNHPEVASAIRAWRSARIAQQGGGQHG